MTREEITKLLEDHKPNLARTMVIIDYGNVEKWKVNLKWHVGIKELAQLVKHFSSGDVKLRRFYYGSDYGEKEKNMVQSEWSRSKLEMAGWNRLEIVTKRVKYIHSPDTVSGFEKKCDLDVEMTVDLIRVREKYDHLVIFSGDGDLMCAVRFLKELGLQTCTVFGARAHIGREVFDARQDGVVNRICFAEDFEYRIKDKYKR